MLRSTKKLQYIAVRQFSTPAAPAAAAAATPAAKPAEPALTRVRFSTMN